MYSIRRQLTLVLAAGFTSLIVGTDVYVVNEMSARSVAEFDAALLAKANAIIVLTEQEKGQVEFDYKPALMPEFEREDSPEYFQFWLDDRTSLLRSNRMPEGEELPLSERPTRAPKIHDCELPDGRTGRMIEIAFVPRGGGPEDGDGEDGKSAGDELVVNGSSEEVAEYLVLGVARSREGLDAAVADMRLAMFGAGALAVLLAGVLIWRTLLVAFKPIDSMATQVRELDANSLNASIELPRTPQELVPIVHQLNALLRRLDASFDRERRFAGNVAHELRTPIAELRSLAVVGAKWPEDRGSVTAFFDDVNDIASRMEGVITDLLLLARCQAGVEATVTSPVGLRQIITSAWLSVSTEAARSDLDLDLALPEGDIILESDPGKLAILLTNILGNAASYSSPKTRIRCVGIKNATGFRIELTNEADPLTDEEMGHLMEPFWRKDEARSAADHAGLGLPLVVALAKLLSLRVRFDQLPDGVFRVRVEGPMLRPSEIDPLQRIPMI